MEFEKNFCLVRQVKNDLITSKILCVAKIIKNGSEYSLSLSFIEKFDYPCYIEIYNNKNKVFSRQIENEEYILIPCGFKDLSICVFKQADVIGFYGAEEILKLCNNASLFEDSEEELEKLIDNEMMISAISEKEIEDNNLKLCVDCQVNMAQKQNAEQPISNKNTSHEQIEKQITEKQAKRNIKQILLGPLYKSYKLRYFKQIEVSLSELFANCARERVLECMFEKSKWVRAETPNGIMVVGIVYKDNKPNFIGIGYPVKMASTKFKDTKLGRMFYYPISINTMFGYYLVFKNANDGKTCKIN